MSIDILAIGLPALADKLLTERAPALDEGSYGAAPAGPDDEIPFG